MFISSAKTVLGRSSNLKGICKNQLAQSIVEKYLELPRLSNISEIMGIGKLSPTVTSFSFLKFTTIIHFSLTEASTFLGITKIGEFHGLVLG